jgi:hypothetical protein
METAHISQATVTTAVKRYLPANEKRTAILIKNNGAEILYLGTKADDKIGNMMPIAASGGSYSNEHNQGEIWLAAAANTTDVRIEEDASD